MILVTIIIPYVLGQRKPHFVNIIIAVFVSYLWRGRVLCVFGGACGRMLLLGIALGNSYVVGAAAPLVSIVLLAALPVIEAGTGAIVRPNCIAACCIDQ